MFDRLTTRVSARALVRAAACCGAAGLGLGAAYGVGLGIQHTLPQTRAQRLAQAAAEGFSDAALRSKADAMAPGALAIAQRHDPYQDLSDTPRDRQAARFAAQLNGQRAEMMGLRGTAGLFSVVRPFRLAGALDGAREMECLTQAVYYEARGETPSGQAAVAQVVLNRVRHPAFPKSICGVVFQGAQTGRICQFSFACDGSMRLAVERSAWRRSQRVAARALGGFVMAEVANATHFHAARVGPNWGGMIRVSQVGLHVFYRFGGRMTPSAPEREPGREDTAPAAVYASILPVEAAAHFLGMDAGAGKPKTEAAKPADDAVEAADVKTAPAKPAAPEDATLSKVTKASYSAT